MSFPGEIRWWWRQRPRVTNPDFIDWWKRRPRLIKESYPKLAYQYATKISEITELPVEKVLQSRPVQKYIERLEERIRV